MEQGKKGTGEEGRGGYVAVKIRSHRQLEVGQRAFAVSQEIFWLSKKFPREEMYSLTSQIRRSSRSVTTSITEAWRRRRYEAAFVSRLNDAEAEAAEAQDWLYYAVNCEYMDKAQGRKLFAEYNKILGMLVMMITNSHKWVMPLSPRLARESEPR
jgi:four helix bundle protein